MTRASTQAARGERGEPARDELVERLDAHVREVVRREGVDPQVDAGVVRRIADWDWSPGLLPPADAPVWPMSYLRDRLLTAFGPE